MGVRVEVPLACCRSDAPVGNAGRASQGGISVETSEIFLFVAVFYVQQEKSRGAFQLQHTAARICKDLWCTTTQKSARLTRVIDPRKKRRVWEVLRISDIKDIKYIKISKSDIKDR